MIKRVLILALVLASPVAAQCPSRAYTVAEVDDLRQAIELKMTHGWYQFPEGVTTSSGRMQKVEDIEARLRTAMSAGHTANDLRASERPQPELPLWYRKAPKIERAYDPTVRRFKAQAQH